MRADLAPQSSSIVQAQSPSQEHGICATSASLPNGVGECQTKPMRDVGEVRHIHSAGPRLTDEQREAAIERAGVLIYRYMGIWERSGCFAARGDADRARRLMEQLIAGRSPEQVARLGGKQ